MPPTTATPDTPANLLASHSLLRLLRHRNKNQHGKSKWWKWLCILERTVLKLVQAVEAEHSNTPAAGAGISEVERYKEYLAVHAVPRCYLAFSTVVADNQFAVLGVVLLSILADLASVLRIRLDSLPGGSFPRASVLAEKKEEKGEATDATDQGAREATPVASEDVGEVVYRGKDTPVSAEGSESTPSAAIDTGPAGAMKKKKKKKEKGKLEDESAVPKKKSRKTKNTIDDLFNGVL